jgi:DNA-binding response OmpR family regulator
MARSLVLHEEPDWRELIKRVLIENGHEVVTFAEEKEALGWAKSHPLDLAIVSLGLTRPQNNTWKEFKALNKDLKILIIAGHETKELARELLTQEADDYLLEPVEIANLEDKLRSVLPGVYGQCLGSQKKGSTAGEKVEFHEKRTAGFGSTKED